MTVRGAQPAWAILGVLVLSLAVVTGCSGEPGRLSGDIALYRPTGNGGDTALLEGELVRDGGCTYLRTDHGERWLPIFPADAVWRDDSIESGGRRYRQGSTVGLAGSEGRRDLADHLPDGCADDVPAWMVARR